MSLPTSSSVAARVGSSIKCDRPYSNDIQCRGGGLRELMIVGTHAAADAAVALTTGRREAN